MRQWLIPRAGGLAAPMQPAAGCRAGLLTDLLTPSLAGCSEPAPPDEAAPRPIAWAEVRPAERAARRSLSGVVRTLQRAPLSFDVPGRIATLDVEVGERFASGEILARLNPRSYFALPVAEDFPWQERFDLAEHVRDRLYAVPGTKRVDLLGVQPERIFIEARDAHLAELGLDPDRLAEMLRRQNTFHPGGLVDTGARGMLVEPTGRFDDAEAVAETLVTSPGGQGVIALRDIAEVRRAAVHQPAMGLIDGGAQIDQLEQLLGALGGDADAQDLLLGGLADAPVGQRRQAADAAGGATPGTPILPLSSQPPPESPPT